MGSQEIAEQLAQDIRAAVYPPGSRLVQHDIAQRFQVSRIPVREALQNLAAQGLIDFNSGGGATVRDRNSGEVRELYELRLLLEPPLSRHMLGGVTPRRLRRLELLAEEMDTDVDLAAWRELNFDFHCELNGLIERPHTESILRLLLAAVQPYSLENVGLLGGRAQATREHHQMVQALKDEDAELLAALIRQHLEVAMERVATAHDQAGPDKS
jgi:DNA-binding GntR family transcriptional regulator